MSSPPAPKAIRHKVTAADTLLGVALMYDVSLPALKAVNKLTTNDIWQKAELIIPRSEVPAAFVPREECIVRGAAGSQTATALQRLTGCDEPSAKECLSLTCGDFKEALSLLREAMQTAAELNVQLADIFIYTKMFDGDARRALQELKQDVQWERQQQQLAGSHVDNGDRRDGARGQATKISIRELVTSNLSLPPPQQSDSLLPPAAGEGGQKDEPKKDR